MEELVAVLLLRERPRSSRMRPSRGDRGIDVITPASGGPIIDQIKCFAGPSLSSHQKAQIVDSLDTVQRALGGSLSQWNLLLPMDHTPEQFDWFHSLGLPFEANWLGRSHLDSLAARYPDVVDYFVHGGRVRVEQQWRDLQRVSSLAHIAPNSPELAPGQIVEAIAAAHAAVNRSDPLYMYDYRVSGVPLDAPTGKPGYVFSQFTGFPDGTHVAIDVYARFDQATEIRPIRGSLVIEAETDEQQQAIRDWLDYGEPVDLEGEVRFEGGLPGGFTSPEGPMAISIRPIPPAASPDLEIRLVDPAGLVLAVMALVVNSVSVGEKGLTFSAADRTGLLRFRGRASRQERRFDLRFTVDVEQLEGRPIVECRDAVRLLTGMDGSSELHLATRGGRALARVVSYDESFDASDYEPMLRVLDDLCIIQTRSVLPLLWNAQEAEESQVLISEYAHLLRGNAIEGTWTDVTVNLTMDDVPSVPGHATEIVFEEDVVFTGFGVSVEIGRERTTATSALCSLDAEAGVIRCVPAANKRMSRQLIPR